MRRVFGWSLPPGVTNRMIEDAAGVEMPCEICGNPADICICPECPRCGSQGDINCYDPDAIVCDGGLVKTADQLATRANHEARRRAEETMWAEEAQRVYEEQTHRKRPWSARCAKKPDGSNRYVFGCRRVALS